MTLGCVYGRIDIMQAHYAPSYHTSATLRIGRIHVFAEEITGLILISSSYGSSSISSLAAAEVSLTTALTAAVIAASAIVRENLLS